MILTLLLPSLTWAQSQDKMSPYVRKAAMEYHISQSRNRRNSPSTCATTPEITALVKTSDFHLLKEHGCRIYATWDDICIASIPLSKITFLCSSPSVRRIEAGRSCGVTNDNSAVISRASDAWHINPQMPVKGKGVIVGVMDIGFDLTHPNWYSTDMQEYRIKQLWDMLDTSEGGTPVIGRNAAGEDTIHVGRQYVGSDAIIAKRHTADAMTQYHGTHTMGTAAGSGSEGNGVCQYVGMAPEADLCVVANYTTDNQDVIPESDIYRYTTATDLLGFKYIFDYAESVGKPCVINFSEGCHEDLREAGIYREVLSKMTGSGRIICSSAGNEGNGGTYLHKEEGVYRKGAFLKSSSKEAQYVMRSTKPSSIQLTFYQSGTYKLSWSYDMTHLAEYPDSVMSDTIYVGKEKFAFSLSIYPSCYDSTLYATDLIISDVNNSRFGSNTDVSLVVSGSSNDIEVIAAGGSFTGNPIDSTLSDFESTHNIYFPSSAESVICVGATAHVTTVESLSGMTVGDDLGTDGVRANFSGVGPTLNGTTKPDVMAPGVNIVSSTNSYRQDLHLEERYGSRVFEYDGRKHYWALAKGTSMSCPVVTGIIALWLQVCPTLTPNQIRDVFAHTCTHYDDAMNFPNNYYGWGEIDALAGMEYIQNNITGIRSTEHHHTAITERKTYNINGMRVAGTTPHGIYVISDGISTRKAVK